MALKNAKHRDGFGCMFVLGYYSFFFCLKLHGTTKYVVVVVDVGGKKKNQRVFFKD